MKAGNGVAHATQTMYNDVCIYPNFQIFNHASEYVGFQLGITKSSTLARDKA